MVPVDPLGVTERDILHDAGKWDIFHLDNQMDMVGHEAERVYAMAESLNPFLQEKVKAVPVLITEKDVLFAIATENDMVNSAGIMDAGFASHAGTISHESTDAKPDPITCSRINRCKA